MRKMCSLASTSICRKYLLWLSGAGCGKPSVAPAPAMTSVVSNCELLGVHALIVSGIKSWSLHRSMSKAPVGLNKVTMLYPILASHKQGFFGWAEVSLPNSVSEVVPRLQWKGQSHPLLYLAKLRSRLLSWLHV